MITIFRKTRTFGDVSDGKNTDEKYKRKSQMGNKRQSELRNPPKIRTPPSPVRTTQRRIKPYGANAKTYGADKQIWKRSPH